MRILVTSSTVAIAAATLGMAVLPAQARAQTAEPSADTAAGDQDGIADIIVTATRREESSQRTAIPVTAITGDALDAMGVANVQTLTKLAPTLKLGQSQGGGIQITARGVGNLGANSANEPGVPINYDGAYLARSFGSNGIFFDVARVEFLKGPQGTLYGRNSTGGVLNIITNDPTKKLGANLTLESGNYGLLRASAAINLPISEGVALRISGQAIERRGYLTDGYNDDKGYAGRAKLLLEPSEKLSILLEANFAVTKGQGIASVFSPFIDPSNPYVGPSDPRSNAIIAAVPGVGAILPKIGTDGFQNNTSRQFIGTVNYDLGAAKATLIVANTRNTQNYKGYAPGFPVVEDTRPTPNTFTTVELRLGSSGNGPLKWVVGGFYFNEVLTVNPFVDQGTTFGDTRNLRFPIKSYSGFGEATYSVTPSIRLTAGGRYTSDEKSLDGITLNPRGGPLKNAPCSAPATLVTYSGPATAAQVGTTGLVCSTPDIGAATFSKFTYKLGAEVDLGPNSLLYANYTTGFKSGGFYASANYNAAGAFPSNAYRPETISAITVGSKNRFFGNTLQVNVEGFYWKYKDKQISHLGFVPPNNQLLVVDNAGSASLYGAELDVIWKPTHNDDIAFNVQYLHSKYDNFSYVALVPAWAAPFAPSAAAPIPTTGCSFTATVGANGAARGTGSPGLSTIDCTGRELSLAPTWSASATYRHTFELSDGSTLVPSVSTRIESGHWVGEEYFAGQYQDSYMMSDASLTWAVKDKRFSLTAYVNNIENEAVAQGSSLNGTIRKALNVLRAPRTYGIRASIRF
jgi:iron complex outermembrane recepter protein